VRRSLESASSGSSNPGERKSQCFPFTLFSIPKKSNLNSTVAVSEASEIILLILDVTILVLSVILLLIFILTIHRVYSETDMTEQS
jgi:hypothetical protein